MPYTVVSYNIHSGIGPDGRFDLYRVLDVLQEIRPDVVALQECGDFRGRTGHDEHPELLAAALGMDLAFAPNVIRNHRRYGNAILSKFPIRYSQNYDLSLGHREPRGALRCDLEVDARTTLHVFCLHLGLWPHERRGQEALLLSADIFQEAAREDPLIVCGDFNYFWSGPVPALVRHSIHDAALMLKCTESTFPSPCPWLRLDRFFVDEEVDPISVHVHRSNLAQQTSDHLPLVMNFRLKL